MRETLENRTMRKALLICPNKYAKLAALSYTVSQFIVEY